MNPTETSPVVHEDVKAQLQKTLDDLVKGIRSSSSSVAVIFGHTSTR